MEAVSTQDMEGLYRAAVGEKKADFYVPKFVRFDRPGASRLSWNWPAFFVSFYWFLYRRMYATWAIYSLLIPIGIGVYCARWHCFDWNSRRDCHPCVPGLHRSSAGERGFSAS
jgi:hypothetical protein